MTIAVGANPTPAIRVGGQSTLTSGILVGSGALTLTLDVGGASGIAGTHRVGTGSIALKPFLVEPIAIQPTIRRGTGDVSVQPAVGGTGAPTGHPGGTGAIPLRVRIAGDAIRTVAGVGQHSASGNLPIRVVLAGQGVIQQRYILGSGDLIIGPLVVKDIPPGVASVIRLEGVFMDGDLDGVYLPTVELEGIR